MFVQKRLRVFAGVLLALVLAAAAYGFAAANTVPDSRAGDGQGTVSGYAVSNIRYTLDTNNPSLVSGVSFDLDASASQVYAAVGDGATWTWSGSCANGGGNAWSCSFTSQPAVGSITQLRVVATGP